MKITDFPMYKKIKAKFDSGEFKNGTKCELPIYSYEKGMKGPLTPGHYVSAIKYGQLTLKDVPVEFRTRDFFICALSDVFKDVVEYVKAHLGTEFDREFFKDHIVSAQYSIEFEENCFEYMPLEYIDEEMISCAMLKAVDARYVERRGDFEGWFYSVAKRKPEVLTQDFWILGARLFASKIHGENKFLQITPKEYRTEDYYFAMCLENDTPVMEDIPAEILTTNFLISLINDNPKNIRSFSEAALERTAPMQNHSEEVKFWQAAIINDGYVARELPLNDERVEFFLKHYAKDSNEYKWGFKDEYKRFLKKKNGENEKPKNDDTARAAELTILGALAGIGTDAAIDMANKNLQARMNRSALLPIKYEGGVPEKYCKTYDEEEYLVEIYKKLGIQIVGEHDYYYYDVILPPNLKVEQENYDYVVKDDNNNVLFTYWDFGPFYDRSVNVKEINVSLD